MSKFIEQVTALQRRRYSQQSTVENNNASRLTGERSSCQASRCAKEGRKKHKNTHGLAPKGKISKDKKARPMNLLDVYVSTLLEHCHCTRIGSVNIREQLRRARAATSTLKETPVKPTRAEGKKGKVGKEEEVKKSCTPSAATRTRAATLKGASNTPQKKSASATLAPTSARRRAAAPSTSTSRTATSASISSSTAVALSPAKQKVDTPRKAIKSGRVAELRRLFEAAQQEKERVEKDKKKSDFDRMVEAAMDKGEASLKSSKAMLDSPSQREKEKKRSEWSPVKKRMGTGPCDISKRVA